MKTLTVVLMSEEHQNSPWIQIVQQALLSLSHVHCISTRTLSPNLQADACDLVVIDAARIEDILSTIKAIKCAHPLLPIIVSTASPTWRRARDAFQAGASDYVARSYNRFEILETILSLLNTRQELLQPKESEA